MSGDRGRKSSGSGAPFEPRTGSISLGGAQEGEFGLIREMVAQWGALAQGIGDDAAMLTVPDGECLVVSTDAAVEGVHFRREWMSLREIGYRAAVAALSDLAAMGARPIGLLIALSLPRGARRDALEIAEGIGDAATAALAPIVGGNLSAASGISLTTTVLGATPTPIRRSGVKPGDLIHLTGVVGGVKAALEALIRGDDPTPEQRARLVRPSARLVEGQWLAAQGVHAMIDVSDGVAADVRHLAAASDVRIVLELDDLPCHAGVAPIDAAQSGEEFELAFAAPPTTDLGGFAARFGVPVTAIGRAMPGAPGVVLERRGKRVALPPGHDHFSE